MNSNLSIVSFADYQDHGQTRAFQNPIRGSETVSTQTPGHEGSANFNHINWRWKSQRDHSAIWVAIDGPIQRFILLQSMAGSIQMIKRSTTSEASSTSDNPNFLWAFSCCLENLLHALLHPFLLPTRSISDNLCDTI